jgi:hypothetical protein
MYAIDQGIFYGRIRARYEEGTEEIIAPTRFAQK